MSFKNGKQRIILYERILVGNLAVVAVMTRWFVLCRRHRGAYSNTWCPWQQNNIRRSRSDELVLPKTKRWMAGWKLCRSTKDLIHSQQNSRLLSEAEASASPLLSHSPSPGNQKCEFISRFHSRQERCLDHKWGITDFLKNWLKPHRHHLPLVTKPFPLRRCCCSQIHSLLWPSATLGHDGI